MKTIPVSFRLPPDSAERLKALAALHKSASADLITAALALSGFLSPETLRPIARKLFEQRYRD